MHHTLVAGIGNVLMGDDAIGATVVAHLEARFVFPDGVKVADLGTPGMDLALHLTGVGTVLMIDALVDSSAQPGLIRVMRREEILAGPAAAGMDPHAAGLREALLLAERHGGSPERVSLIAVVAGSCLLGDGLSDGVRAAVPAIVEAVAVELRSLAVPFTERAPALVPDLWWTR